MELAELLAFAVKSKAAELLLAPGLPPQLIFPGEPVARRINIAALDDHDIDQMLAPLLSPEAKEALKFRGRREISYALSGLGSFTVRISKAQAVFILPPPLAKPPAGDGTPGFFRKLFGN